jgi:hypothetical protein
MTVESSATLALDITAPMQCLSTNLLAASTSGSSGILVLLLLRPLASSPYSLPSPRKHNSTQNPGESITLPGHTLNPKPKTAARESEVLKEIAIPWRQ